MHHTLNRALSALYLVRQRRLVPLELMGPAVGVAESPLGAPS